MALDPARDRLRRGDRHRLSPPRLRDRDVDVLLIEGIFLLKRELRAHYDLALWVECSFERSLERAVARAQEGLAPEATIAAYRTVYFPAQERRFAIDRPREAADLVIANDPVAPGR